MEFVPEAILRDILLRLPTRDVASCCCVCKPWRAVVADPSFRTLHGKATHVVSGGCETLLVTEIRAPGQSLEAIAMPMPRITDLAAAYSPTNACNGFLCLASGVKNWPVFICNPAIPGDRIRVPPPPKIKSASKISRRVFAMGHAPRTGQYKLFHLSFPFFPDDYESPDLNYLDVYTLGPGGSGGWRRHPRKFPYHAGFGPRTPPPPALVGGELYVVLTRPEYEARGRHAPDRLLAIDVATEEHRTRRLPEYEAEFAAVHALDLRGRLCVAAHAFDRRLLSFWLDADDGATWELLHTFYIGTDEGEEHYDEQLTGAWFDGMLCYRINDRLYKYDIDSSKKKQWMVMDDGSKVLVSAWDERIRLPETPWTEDQRGNVYGGYRPSLLSPRLAFQDDSFLCVLRDERRQQQQFQHDLLHAMRSRKPSSPANNNNNNKRRRSTDRAGGRRRASKRIVAACCQEDDDDSLDGQHDF
ncbi:hypothetical protein BRADI_3g00365v3 [Brachypodium distachyon]|uniref:F-box domain-containing protein n=1 Tax=Brachypodium distachyon TaxID=15368 RepID=A0A0Q3HWR5_BRADI|nr:hypothetical protein BRADI_3g00365v3 [Brachypodium distachyon]